MGWPAFMYLKNSTVCHERTQKPWNTLKHQGTPWNTVEDCYGAQNKCFTRPVEPAYTMQIFQWGFRVASAELNEDKKPFKGQFND